MADKKTGLENYFENTAAKLREIEEYRKQIEKAEKSRKESKEPQGTERPPMSKKWVEK